MSDKVERKELKKAKKLAKKAVSANKWKILVADFRKFISKGNVLDMAVGVIMGSAFNGIVTAFTSILLSICTWGVPGGISGLVTVLPAANAAQMVPTDITVGGEALKQSYTASEWATLSQSDGFTAAISNMYTKHGSSFYYNGTALIDWGTFINAIISFLIIALTLFVIVKVFSSLKAKRLALEEQLRIARLKKQGIEPQKDTPATEPAKKPDDIVLLEEIRDEIRKLHSSEAIQPTAQD